jgi:hypothetical protein
MQDSWDNALEQMFADLVAGGDWKVVKHDAAGKPISWRRMQMTDARIAELLRERGKLQ